MSADQDRLRFWKTALLNHHPHNASPKILEQQSRYHVLIRFVSLRHRVGPSFHEILDRRTRNAPRSTTVNPNILGHPKEQMLAVRVVLVSVCFLRSNVFFNRTPPG
jgi:hypothetical protein